MRQFDAPKKKKTTEIDSEMDEEADELAGALDELEDELEGYEDDAEDDWENDMRAEMAPEEVQRLEKCVKPVRGVLNKVSRTMFVVVM
jgi:hypothetical protein